MRIDYQAAAAELKDATELLKQARHGEKHEYASQLYAVTSLLFEHPAISPVVRDILNATGPASLIEQNAATQVHRELLPDLERLRNCVQDIVKSAQNAGQGNAI